MNTEDDYIKINISVDSEEVILVCSDGGVACIRSADPLDEDTPRVATTEYYQSRLTDIDPTLIVDNDEECIDVWSLLGEGSMYYNDWQETPYNSLFLINEALEWLGHDPAKCVLVDYELFPEHFKT